MDHARDGRLAVGAGDADGPGPARGRAEDRGRGPGGVRTGVGDDEHGQSRGGAALPTGLVGQGRDRAALGGLGGEVGAVGARPLQGAVEVARAHRARVERDPGDARVGVAVEPGVEHARERRARERRGGRGAGLVHDGRLLLAVGSGHGRHHSFSSSTPGFPVGAMRWFCRANSMKRAQVGEAAVLPEMKVSRP